MEYTSSKKEYLKEYQKESFVVLPTERPGTPMGMTIVEHPIYMHHCAECLPGWNEDNANYPQWLDCKKLVVPRIIFLKNPAVLHNRMLLFSLCVLNYN